MPDDFLPRLLLKMPAALGRELTRRPFGIEGSSFRVRPLCPNEALAAPQGVAAADRWYLAEANPASVTSGELWELAHQAVRARSRNGMSVYAEPDVSHQWLYENRERPTPFGAAPGEAGVFNDQDPDFPRGPGFAWHLGDDYSQLKAARDHAGQPSESAAVRIGILDTGFDFEHRARPANILDHLARNFVDDGQASNDASDPYARGFANHPGHGTGTIGILAGRRLSGMRQPDQNTRDFLGGAPHAGIIPLRIATGVVLFRTSAFVEALDYLIAPNGDAALRADVVSMSMGGVASQAWAEVVNRAYEAGLCIVTAAGNNKRGSPQTIVYPARFRRVIAACGIMENRRPYIRDVVGWSKMSGNYGPDSKMDTAIAAFTPNTPWAEINCPDLIDMDGAGTSSATPQVAAAAALWLQAHKASTDYSEPWMLVEAVRHALFSSADTSPPDCRKYFGRGVLRARRALDVAPVAEAALRPTPPDNADFAIIDILTGRGFAAGLPPQGSRMLQVEALQLLQRDPSVERTLTDPDVPAERMDRGEIKQFLEAAIESEYTSSTLRGHLKRLYGDQYVAGPVPAAPAQTQTYQRTPDIVPVQPPVRRRLRGFAFDPDLATRLEMTDISTCVFQVRWENRLRPGPVGDYIEVVDYDPASGGYYAPVNLDLPELLAEDGRAPAESNPQFHQQFVYAVAMKTIETFERALGRIALWSPRVREGEDPGYVGRLRIYPHALREANAYYHPEKKALLFGYFPSRAGAPGRLYPQGIVFTCLSHDIVAHETTHALLDGLHRAFNRPSNRDQLAFHEAFADIVALFQHFSLPDVVQHQIARTRGDLRARNILGELAGQFGEATGLRGALRSYIGHMDSETGKWKPIEPDPGAYERIEEPHYRGALLVAAVFDAFLSIYERRSADLVCIASGGTGVLPTGNIHPNLVVRLADEAAKTARHVLTMCVRALDYCPPVDLTFGDYLRALITADFDLIPDDPFCYRIAFVEAFRRRGIYPLDLTTLSVGTLRWNPPTGNEHRELQKVFRPVLQQLRRFAAANIALETKVNVDARRKAMFHLARGWREKLHRLIRSQLAMAADRKRLMVTLGLDLTRGDEPFEVHALHLSRKEGAFGRIDTKVILSLVQQRTVETVQQGRSPGTMFPFEGGCTIICDPERLHIDYVICKNILSPRRRERQSEFNMTDGGDLAACYFGESALAGMAQRFAMLHACEGEEANA